MGHFLDRLEERAPWIDIDTLQREIVKWKKAGKHHGSFTFVCLSERGDDIYRYNQGEVSCYLVLNRRHDTFATVYTQEYIRSTKAARKRRKRYRHRSIKR